MKFLYLIFFVSSVSCNQVNYEKQKKSTIEKADSLPMKLSYQKLKEKCYTYTKLFNERKKFTNSEYVDIVRTYNTISLNRLRERDSIFVSYDELFFKNYLNDVAKLFEATISKGLGYYSKKYDLDIGGSAPNNNSYFKIEE